jgi:hypothetical protein
MSYSTFTPPHDSSGSHTPHNPWWCLPYSPAVSSSADFFVGVGRVVVLALFYGIGRVDIHAFFPGDGDRSGKG